MNQQKGTRKMRREQERRKKIKRKSLVVEINKNLADKRKLNNGNIL